MVDINLINQILIFAIDFAIVFFSIVVFLDNKKGKVNQIFSFWAFCSLFWITSGFLADYFKDASLSLLFMRIRFGAVSLFYIFAYFFAQSIYQRNKKYPVLNILVVVISISSFLLSAFTNFIIRSVAVKNWGSEIIFGSLAFAFYIAISILTIIVSVILIRGYTTCQKFERTRIQYFLIGALVFILTNLIFNVGFPLAGTYRYHAIGDYSALFLFGFIAYGIVRKQLFGIKVILTQMFVGLIGILLFVDFLASSSPFEYFWKGGVVVAFLFFGWLLVKSVKKEIQQREALDNFSKQLATANERLAVAYKKLKQLDKAKSEFVSIASHQLRAPLTAIKGYISMLSEGDYGEIPETAKTPMKNVYTSNERLIALVNSLLDISRIESGKVKYEESEFSIEEMINSLVEEFKLGAQARNLYLKLETEKDKIGNIKADSGKLRQVIGNLIDNAIKYTAKGGVVVKLKSETGKITIIVEDTGAGIAKDELLHLFQSFSRAGAGKRFWIEGAGLGLYIARKFIDMHKGKIWAESDGKGKGSRFIVELPAGEVKE